jgi:predicted DsbA family dithiol-disulfide isomerase
LDGTMRIDIWSDVVCPWCFLGKRRFERALAELGEAAGGIEVRWRAFQLDPTATSEPGDLRRSIEKKYGHGAFDGMVARLTALGEPEGIGYRFDIAQRVNTLDAHRLVAWAWDVGGADAQGALVERLFTAYFHEGANVADHDVLVALATETGLDSDGARGVLSTGAYQVEVRDDLVGAIDRQITGVPAFVVADRLLIPGAQEVDTFRQILERALTRLA